ncbi:glycosyltransferase family 1 protein [Ornithinibacillus gellani]|uniref:glycosyltransferase family 1 protein n=1 Tax=Ornithinibacillus gellani TaxID=2293253 RepID=UPI000F49B4B4|nr:glycosyltransferase family 1 protein [Ornithinibacillus gellani]TQS74135.1 glycosyltransferase family 1 protein [Ornithinibacillus gellani]
MGGPLRVLHVVVNMNRGGAETLIMNLYRNMDRNRIQFDFLTCRDGAYDQEIQALGGRLYQIPYVTDIGHSAFLKKVCHFLQMHPQYKVVHSHLDKMSGIVLQAAKRAKVPIRIAHSHNTESEGGLAAKLYKWYAGSLVQGAATHYYACSDQAAKWMFGAKAKQASILKNGVDVEQFQFSEANRIQMRRLLDIASDQLVVGHVGRFNRQKNHLFLLTIFAEIIKKHPNAILLLIGDGDQRVKIEQRINALGLESQVKLLGIRDDIAELLQAIDIFIFPSFHEGLPVTLVEAQSAGLPCLISNRITSEVDLGIGLLQQLPLSDPERWVSAAVQLLRNQPSRYIHPQQVEKQGYDIKRTAKLEEQAYLRLGEAT